MLFFIVSLLASIVGAICGVGGGVIIKPCLDLLQLESVSAINFLSGCTVLSMTLYSVGRSTLSGDNQVELRTGVPLAIGGAVGGMAGKQLFTVIRALFAQQNTVGAVQSICLLLVTAGTLVYTLNREKIKTMHVTNSVACGGIGMALGLISGFLGIGGGPINLVVLYYFFSMDTKVAAANSLFIILFSQLSSLLLTFVTAAVPPFQPSALFWMVAGGVLGGVLGRMLNKKVSNTAVERLFVGLMVVIILISAYNSWNYLAN